MQSALQSEVHQSPLWMWQKFTDQGPLQKVLLPNTAIDLQIPILRRLVSISSSIGWVFCISLKWSNIQRNWECSQKRSLKASIERTVSVNNESGVSKRIQRNGILCRKLFWPTVRKKCFIKTKIWVVCISLKWSNIQRHWECSQKRSLKASIERTVSVNNESGVSKGIQRNGIFLQKLIVLVIDPLNNLFEQWESFKLEHKWMIMHPHTYIHSKCQLQ